MTAGRAGTPVEHSGPFVAEPDASDHGVFQSSTPQEIVREVRVHGNVIVPDEEVIRIAGVTVGGALDSSDVAGVELRLHDSGVFASVEVRKRHRSLTDPSDSAVILVVHEKVAVTVTPAGHLSGRCPRDCSPCPSRRPSATDAWDSRSSSTR
jgi:hypothetical protein